MAAGTMQLQASEEEQRTGHIDFIHRGLRKAKDAASSYALLTADTAGAELAGSDGGGSPVSAQPEPGADQGGACSWLCNKIASEVRIACTRAAESWETFLKEAAEMRASLWLATGSIVQWGTPAALVVCSVLVQSFAARLATLYYIRYMHAVEGLSKGNAIHQEIAGHHPVDPLSSAWIYREHLDYPQKLQDLVASWVEEPLDVPPFVWDLTLFPFTLMCLCLIICCRDVYMWAKVCSCFAALNFGRAMCQVSTVVPDSQGWQACQDRLTNFGTSPEAMEQMGSMQVNWRTGIFASLLQVLQAEAKGMRYCADMVYSGQTFVMLLFALGLCEVIQRQWPDHRKTVWVVALFSFPCVVLSSLGALAARYHYTLDVVLAALLTVLWYDSSMLKAACGWWASLTHKVAKERPVFEADRRTVPKVSTFGLVQASCTYVFELVMIGIVTWNFYRGGFKIVALIYTGSLGLTSLVLVPFSLHLFNTDEDLMGIPWILRWPLAIVFGSTHLVFLLTQALSFKRGKQLDEGFVIKVFKACMQSAPLACVQLHTLLRYEDMHTKAHLWQRYLQMIASFYSLGEAVAYFDGMGGSVLQEVVRNALWRMLVSSLRMAEVASRISALVIFQCIAEKKGHPWEGAPALICVDFVISAVLVQYFGVARRKFLAGMMITVMSLTSNVYLFQKNEDKRRLADVLCTVRIAEFLMLGALGIWYVKFYPGGMAEVFGFIAAEKGACILLGVSLTSYFLMLVIWLEIRRAQLPHEWDDKGLAEVQD